MDLVVAVILCNCAMSIACLAIAYWLLGFRRQVVALGNWCERSASDCDCLGDIPESIATSRVQIDRLQQLYQQQLATLDRLRAIALFIGIVRSIAFGRR
jgi:hypothetical protein